MAGPRDRIQEIEERLSRLDADRKALTDELVSLRAQSLVKAKPLLGTVARSVTPALPDEKVDLFLSLFRCRDSVYPKLWENQKAGKKGYAPACSSEWVRGVCEKPRIKCSECPNQAFLKLDALTVKNHLQGVQTI